MHGCASRNNRKHIQVQSQPSHTNSYSHSHLTAHHIRCSFFCALICFVWVSSFNFFCWHIEFFELRKMKSASDIFLTYAKFAMSDRRSCVCRSFCSIELQRFFFCFIFAVALVHVKGFFSSRRMYLCLVIIGIQTNTRTIIEQA